MKKLLSFALIVAVAALSLGLISWSHQLSDSLGARMLAIVGSIIGLGWMMITFLIACSWLSEMLRPAGSPRPTSLNDARNNASRGAA